MESVKHSGETNPFHDVVREFYPYAHDGDVGFILWNFTGYPGFWNIPEDGETPIECCRTQVRKLAKSAPLLAGFAETEV